MGPRRTVSDSGKFSHNWDEKKPREDQGHSLHNRFHLRGVGGESVQATGDGRRRKVLGEEDDTGKLHQVRRGGGTIISQTEHGEPTWNLLPPDKEG